MRSLMPLGALGVVPGAVILGSALLAACASIEEATQKAAADPCGTARAAVVAAQVGLTTAQAVLAATDHDDHRRDDHRQAVALAEASVTSAAALMGAACPVEGSPPKAP